MLVDYKPCMYAVGNTAHCIWEKTSDRIHVRCVIGKNCLATLTSCGSKI